MLATSTTELFSTRPIQAIILKFKYQSDCIYLYTASFSNKLFSIFLVYDTLLNTQVSEYSMN
jgi:hypothetical protein